MVKNREINGTDEIALVTPTPVLLLKYCYLVCTESEYGQNEMLWRPK